MISRNDPRWCGSQQKWKKCHYPQKPPQDLQTLTLDYFNKFGIVLKTPEHLEKIRPACLLHHKWIYIDQTTLVLGSANLTQAAFKKNRDCL